MTAPSLTMLGPQMKPCLHCPSPPPRGPQLPTVLLINWGLPRIISGSAPWITLMPGKELTLFQLVPNHSEEGYGDHEQVGQEASLTQLPHGGAT